MDELFCMAPSPSSRLSLSHVSLVSCFVLSASRNHGNYLKLKSCPLSFFLSFAFLVLSSQLLATMASTSRRRPFLEVVFVLLHRIAANFDEEFIKPHENNEVEPSIEVVVPSLSECEGLHLFYRLSLMNKRTRRFSRREYPALYDLSCVIVRARARGFTWK